MRNRLATASFIISIVGATYQMLSYGLSDLVDPSAHYYNLGTVGFSGVTLTSLVVFWAASHLADNQGYRRVAWASIILSVGVAYLGNVLIQWIVPTRTITGLNIVIPTGVFLVLLPGPLLLALAGLLGISDLRHPPQALALQ